MSVPVMELTAKLSTGRWQGSQQTCLNKGTRALGTSHWSLPFTTRDACSLSVSLLPRERRCRPCCSAVQPTEQFGILPFLEQHKVLQRPAAHNIRYSAALEDFTGMAVMAYECGLSETTLQQELLHVGPNDIVQEDEGQVEACLQDLALVWITLDAVTSVGEINMAARSTTRWAKGPAVSEERRAAWYGFVRMIVDGYFKKRWAWYPIDRLQLELRLTAGRVEAPADVAQWAGIVYSTLHHSSPMFPTK